MKEALRKSTLTSWCGHAMIGFAVAVLIFLVATPSRVTAEDIRVTNKCPNSMLVVVEQHYLLDSFCRDNTCQGLCDKKHEFYVYARSSHTDKNPGCAIKKVVATISVDREYRNSRIVCTLKRGSTIFSADTHGVVGEPTWRFTWQGMSIPTPWDVLPPLDLQCQRNEH